MIHKQWMDGCVVVGGKGDLFSIFIKVSDDAVFNLWIPLPNEEFIIQQFTGLKDIQKKEIYEGDIVKVIMHHDDAVTSSLLGEVRTGTVVYDESRAQFLIKFNESTSFSMATYPKDMEIVGNIFENP